MSYLYPATLSLCLGSDPVENERKEKENIKMD